MTGVEVFLTTYNIDDIEDALSMFIDYLKDGDEDDKAKELYGKQPSYHRVAWYAPSGANWAYQIGIVEYEGETYEGVFIFGECRAVRLCQIPKYTKEELERR